MGFSFRKSFKIGPARVNVSKSGVGYSVGAKGFRFTKRAGSSEKKKDIGLFGIVWRLLLIGLAIFIVIALAAAVYTLFLRFKGIFIALALLAVAGIIVALVIRKRRHEVDTPPADDLPVE